MTMKTQKRLAADLMKVGVHRVRTVQEAGSEIAMAITREDVRKLIAKGYIYAAPANNTSRGRIREASAQKKKHRRSGHGSRKGAKNARDNKKKLWITRIRALRNELQKQKESGKIDARTYRKLYHTAKSGVIRNKAHLNQMITQAKGK